MADEEEVLYDDTLTREDETTDDKSIDTGSTPSRRAEGVKTLSSAQPLRRSQETLDRRECSAIYADTQRLSIPGWYYFDGKNLSISRPEVIYTPDSDYCHVWKANDADKNSDKSDSFSESDSSGSENSNDDVQVSSKLSGLKTLNINIRLNVADLVHTSTTSRRHRHKKTRRNTVRRVPHAHYEIAGLINDESADTGKEPVENSMKSVGVETDNVFELPPKRPPKTFRTDAVLSSKNSSMAEDRDQEYEFVGSILPAAGENKSVKRHCSEPVLGSAHAHEEDEEIHGSLEEYYSQIPKTDLTDNDVYSSNKQLQTEVKNLSGTQDWFFTYKERQKAETGLSKSEKADGSFAMISENIEENYHFPFTLLLKYEGKITCTPIKRISEYRRKKYELFNAKKDTILKLVEHFRNKPLPYFKTTLK